MNRPLAVSGSCAGKLSTALPMAPTWLVAGTTIKTAIASEECYEQQVGSGKQQPGYGRLGSAGRGAERKQFLTGFRPTRCSEISDAQPHRQNLAIAGQ